MEKQEKELTPEQETAATLLAATQSPIPPACFRSVIPIPA